MRNILSPFAREILFEKKEHLIKKIPSLDGKQKQVLIDFFNKHPNYEGLIDWNKYMSLTYLDFLSVLQKGITSKSGIKKLVKKTGLEGLKEGKDYAEIYHNDYVYGIVPLNHKASQYIASSYIGNCEGEWCTAMNKSDHWDYYAKEGKILIYFIDFKNKKKMAVLINPDTIDEVEDEEALLVFDEKDNEISYGRAISYIDTVTADVLYELVRKALPYEKTIRGRKDTTILDIIRNFVSPENIILNEDGSYDINESVFLNGDGITSFDGIRFNKVKGNFIIARNRLTSLEGCPQYVGGTFSCSKNRLTSLVGGPKEVKGDYLCIANRLTNLEGLADYIGGEFDCSENNFPNREAIEVPIRNMKGYDSLKGYKNYEFGIDYQDNE